jgi:hypothetical protein
MGIDEVRVIEIELRTSTFRPRTRGKVVVAACKRAIYICENNKMEMCNGFVRKSLIEAGFRESLNIGTFDFFPWWSRDINILRQQDDLSNIPIGNIVGFFRNVKTSPYPLLGHVMIDIDSNGGVVGTNNGCIGGASYVPDYFLLRDKLQKAEQGTYAGKENIEFHLIGNPLNRFYICHISPENLPGS